MNITIVGTGYVGLVTGTCFAETGSQVICVDIDARKVERMKNGEIPIYEPGLDILFNRNKEQGRLQFTTNLKEAVLLAANLSDDADTVAAVCGQIAGAYYGLEEIPKEWLRNLYMAKEIEVLAVKLINKNETSKKGL